jgi:hypothetical protein
VSRLLIGVPARNEAERIAELAARVELGASLLDASYQCRLALAYQTSEDDTLERFTRRPSRIPQLVLESPHDVIGKGANVKLLVHRALDDGDDYLLLIDADLSAYDPCNLARVMAAAAHDNHALVLPLWSRPHGQGNTTNYLACPLIFATHRARVRQPIAGHMLLHRSLLERLDVDALPDDFGIDIMVTLSALHSGLPIGQVTLAAPHHPSKRGNSERIITQVASALLGALAGMPSVDRPDVSWPQQYWDGWEWPVNDGVDPDHLEVIIRHAASEAELQRWLVLGAASDDVVAEMWCDQLADAVRRTRSPHSDISRIVDDLVCPFFVHAEHRARRTGSVAELEQYVAGLGLRLAARLHA